MYCNVRQLEEQTPSCRQQYTAFGPPNCIERASKGKACAKHCESLLQPSTGQGNMLEVAKRNGLLGKLFTGPWDKTSHPGRQRPNIADRRSL
mmetsp:Transcript_8195/g.24667  ORF Transcript_8195/g.24667 Transcript_8195/m.24667 type:complete len:92 (-) Transcript_8195:3080-3355(-)